MDIGQGAYQNCESPSCVLKRKMTNLKRIKLYCKECAADFKPWECDGVVLNTKETEDYGKCPLHIFRMGKNPRRKGIGNLNPKHLLKYTNSRLNIDTNLKRTDEDLTTTTL